VSDLHVLSEGAEHVLLHELREVAQRADCGASFDWRPFAKRYVEFGCSLHVHVLRAGQDFEVPVLKQLCFAFYPLPALGDVSTTEPEAFSGSPEADGHLGEQDQRGSRCLSRFPSSFRMNSRSLT
jgi:hypothetical protein